MSRISSADIYRTIILLVIILLSCRGSVVSAATDSEGLKTEKDFIIHTRGEKGCVTQQCHVQFLKREEFPHEPASSGACDACHNAGAYPARFGIVADQGPVCAGCHQNLDKEIKDSSFVHGPVRNGDCTACHNPHGSGRQHFLRETYSNLCSTCHNLKRQFSGDSVHQPVKDGNCGLCHDPHASNYASRLTDVGANLCVICHEEMVEGMTMDFIHAPLVKSGCSDCHDPHSGESSSRLKAAADKICFSCHEEKKNEISQYARKHEPAEKGRCVSCHSPHFSQRKFLLLDKVDTLCFTCHKENSSWKKRRFQHGPVVQGNCSACHNPHGSDNPYILRLAFPHAFYSAYEKGEYDLCFNCHKEALVTTEKTATITNFRNGDTNLHMLHVNQKKGRTCRACHDVHASDQEDHIRTEFEFGSATIPVEYIKTETGGRCVPGCHSERGYDRVKMVENRK